MMMDLYTALNAAMAKAGDMSSKRLADDLCSLRGLDPWELVHIGGQNVPRWHAALAELIILGVIHP